MTLSRLPLFQGRARWQGASLGVRIEVGS